MEFKQLWQEYRHQLRNFLLSKVKNPSDVDDLLQEILIKTYQKLNTVKEADKFSAWLFQIARNTLTDYYRKSHRDTSHQQIVEKAIFTDEESEQYEQVRRELTKCIRPFLQQLPPKYRDAIEAVDLQGMSQKALAIELQLSHSAIKSRVQRARHMLRELFHECCHYQLDVRGNLVDFESKSANCSSC